MSTFARKVLIACVGLLLINAVGMWTVLYLDHAKINELKARDDQFSGSPTTSSSVKAVPVEDQKALEKRVETLETEQEETEERVNILEDSVEDLENKQTTSRSTGSTVKTGQKEYTIYLGEGSTISRDWTSVQATTLALDTANYQHISAVYFEAGLSTNGGEAYAQLINANTSGIISSQLMHNSPNPTWKSTKISLLSGNQMYVVQIRSSSGETMTLSGARLRIIAD